MQHECYQSGGDGGQTAVSSEVFVGVGAGDGDTGGQGESLYTQNLRVISSQLEDIRSRVLSTVSGTIQEQLQQYERAREMQFDQHCEAMRQMLQEQCKELCRMPQAEKQATSALPQTIATEVHQVAPAPARSSHDGEKSETSEALTPSEPDVEATHNEEIVSSELMQREAQQASSSSYQKQGYPSTSSTQTKIWESAGPKWGLRTSEVSNIDDLYSQQQNEMDDISIGSDEMRQDDRRYSAGRVAPPVLAAFAGVPLPPNGSAGAPVPPGSSTGGPHDAPPLLEHNDSMMHSESSEFNPVMPLASERSMESCGTEVVASASMRSVSKGPRRSEPALGIEYHSSHKSDDSDDDNPRPKLNHSTTSKSMGGGAGDEKSGMTLWKRTQTQKLCEERREALAGSRSKTQELDHQEVDKDHADRNNFASSTRKSMRKSVEFHMQSSRLQRLVRTIVHHPWFGALILLGIVGNSFFIGAQTEALISSQIECFGQTSCEQSFVEYKIGEVFFCIFFTLELALRFLDLGANPLETMKQGRLYHFFAGADLRWNVFDTLLVITSFVDIAFQAAKVESEYLSFVKMLRVIRLLRVVRVIRALRFFRSLRLMLHSIIHSATELLWVLVLLSIIMFVFTIYIEVTVIEHWRRWDHQTDEIEEPREDFILQNFGGIVKTMTSLFMTVSGGRDWYEFHESLKAMDVNCGWVFLIYVFFVAFGVLNVVTGAFVDSMRLVSQRDNELVIEQELKKEVEFKHEIKTIFEEADADASGTLSWDEFESHLQNDRVRAYFTSLELDISEARALFVLLDVEETDEVPIEKFITGCLRMRGDAKSIDVNMILYENEKMLCKLTSFTDYAEEVFERLERGLGDVRRRVVNIETMENAHQDPLTTNEIMQGQLMAGVKAPERQRRSHVQLPGLGSGGHGSCPNVMQGNNAGAGMLAFDLPLLAGGMMGGSRAGSPSARRASRRASAASSSSQDPGAAQSHGVQGYQPTNSRRNSQANPKARARPGGVNVPYSRLEAAITKIENSCDPEENFQRVNSGGGPVSRFAAAMHTVENTTDEVWDGAASASTRQSLKSDGEFSPTSTSGPGMFRGRRKSNGNGM